MTRTKNTTPTLIKDNDRAFSNAKKSVRFGATKMRFGARKRPFYVTMT